MAYINKDNVIDIIDNSADIQEVKSCVSMMENADVIKRADFDKVVQTYKLLVDLKELRVTHQEDIINDLHSKINKAIKEIEERIKYSKLPTVNRYNTYSEGLGECLDILRRNIGG